MIAVVSLSALATDIPELQNKIKSSKFKSICDQIVMDPEITGIDGVLLQALDVKTPSKRDAINRAMRNKHPGVCVMYLYKTDAEADLLDTECKYKCKKIRSSDIREAVNKFMGENIIKQGKNFVSSKDFVDPGMNGEAILESKNVVQQQEDEFELIEEEDDVTYTDRNSAPLGTAEDMAKPNEQAEKPQFNIPDIDTSEYEMLEEVPLGQDNLVEDPLNPEPGVQIPEPAPISTEPIESRLARINNIEDWDIYKQNLNKDSIVTRLIQENTEYAGLVDYLKVLDEQINAIWRDNTLTSSEKFDKIQEIGLQRSARRGVINALNIDKAISIITTITMSAKRTVDEKVDSIDLALYKVKSGKEAIMDTSALDKMIQKRTEVQYDLLRAGRDVIDLYTSMDLLVDDMIRSLDEQLPSDNEYINDRVRPLGVQIFTPQNTAALATRLCQALQENRIVASQMESKINNLFDMLFKLCEDDEEIIRYQQNVINQLKANRVEDVIIVDSLLKKCLRLYIGPRNTGVHATAITWCGILSRRGNTLLVDLSCKPKFKDYGIQAIDISDFMQNRIEQQFLCVETTQKLNLEDLQRFVVELKSRLNYYTTINIILDQDDLEMLHQLSKDALTVHYITNCTASALDKMKEIGHSEVVNNIARKLIMIDPPISPIMIAERIDFDLTNTQTIVLPNLAQIRACELTHEHTYEFRDVAGIFEEAFR